MNNTLRVELTDAEREDVYGVVAITFSVWNNIVLVSEEWSQEDESFGDGVTIGIPARVWKLGLEWYAAQ